MTSADLITAALLAFAGASMVSIVFSLVKGRRQLQASNPDASRRPSRAAQPTPAAAYLAREFSRR